MRSTLAPVAIRKLITLGLIASVSAALLLSGNANASGKPAKRGVAGQVKRMPNSYPNLRRFARDLTKLARLGKLQTVKGYDAEIDRVVATLTTSSKTPVLVGESNLERSAIARGLAIRIAAADVPAELLNKQIFSLSLEAIAADAKTSQDFEKRVLAIIAETEKANGQIVLFIDELQEVAGKHATYIASSTLGTALRNSGLRVVGAASAEAYSQYIGSDESLAGIFTSIVIGQTASASNGADEQQTTQLSQAFEGDKVSPDLREMMTKSGTDRVKVLIQAEDLGSSKLQGIFQRHGVEITEQFPQLGTLVVELPLNAIQELADSSTTSYISLDREVRMLDRRDDDDDGDGGAVGHLESTTGAVTMRAQSGNGSIDGDRIGVAVIDSGLFRDHDAMDKVLLEKDFTNDGNGTGDKYGHGTHVTGIIATSDPDFEKFTGIAPKAEIINLRVLNSVGAGSVSSLIAALNWILAPVSAGSPNGEKNHKKYNIRVVNMSLGTMAIDSYKNDPLCRATRRLVDAGIVVVAAAGNNGKDSSGNKLYGHIHSPGNEPSVITIGATNTYGTDERADDKIATFSSRGPTRSYSTDADGVKHYDNLIKPDLVAPGNKVIAPEALTKERINGHDQIVPNYLLAHNPQLHAVDSSNYKKRMMRLSGTSMATPVVSGAAALLLQANPKLTPNMVKMILMYTAQPIEGANTLEQGTGQLNIEGAVRLARQVRTDLTWTTTPQGTLLLKTADLPTPHTTVAGHTFSWAQGILVNYTYATGTNLIRYYQGIYSTGVVLGDAIVLGDGVVLGDSVVLGDGVVLGDNILTSDGVVLGDGTIFLPCHALFGSGVVLGDGTVLGDGVVLGDGWVLGDGVVLGDGGLLTSDGEVLGDGVVLGDAALEAMSAAVGGDPY